MSTPAATGPALVAVAALLWATDTLFRFPTAATLDPAIVVLAEHLVGWLAIAPWILRHHGPGQGWSVVKLSRKEWLASAFVGFGGSAIATVLFTRSFRYIHPSVAILLQKLQPILVVLTAYAFLGERPKSRAFYAWALLALAAGLVLSFPDLDFSFLGERQGARWLGMACSLGAMSLWAFSTVVGRRLLRDQPVGIATFWRYSFAIGLLACWWLYLCYVNNPWAELLAAESSTPGLIRATGERLVYMGLFPGVIAMAFYYSGLKRSRASVTTFVELLYPVGAVVFNSVAMGMPLSPVQTAAGLTLLASVALISLEY